MLIQVARDQHIIVFLCPDRTFASLGGRHIRIKNVAAVTSQPERGAAPVIPPRMNAKPWKPVLQGVLWVIHA